MLVLIKFKVRGNLRFLSHAETVKVFQRACVRAGIKVQYSQGFNPRPKLSLPLPRSVGVETDDDLLCLRVNRELRPVCRAPNEPRDTNYESWIKAGLSTHLPDGCELLTVSVADKKIADGGYAKRYTPYATSATYVLAVRQDCLNERLKTTVERLLASESLNLQRRIDTKNSKFKNVDVRGFLKSIKLNDRAVIVECKISSAGSIRVEEILKLLELDVEKLAAPVRRTNVQWTGDCQLKNENWK